jgi:hypothetical protein
MLKSRLSGEASDGPLWNEMRVWQHLRNRQDAARLQDVQAPPQRRFPVWNLTQGQGDDDRVELARRVHRRRVCDQPDEVRDASRRRPRLQLRDHPWLNIHTDRFAVRLYALREWNQEASRSWADLQHALARPGIDPRQGAVGPEHGSDQRQINTLT